MSPAPEIRLADVGALLREHLPADDPLASYADRLTEPRLGDQSLRGYLTGSVDAVLRVPDGAGHRYLVVDYKTNWLGEPERPLTAADYDRPRLAEAMLHSDYPLQALLYSVVLHRFLRWRLPGYDPAAAPRRCAVPVRARHVRRRHAGGRRAPVRGVQLAAAGRAGCGAVGSARRGEGGRRRRWTRRLAPARADCCGRSTTPASSRPRMSMWRSGSRALAREADERVALAVALVVRALRGGSVCVDLRVGRSTGRR